MDKRKMIFICSTNLTRSPLAAALITTHRDAENLKLEAVSAGCYTGTASRNVDYRLLEAIPSKILPILKEHKTKEVILDDLLDKRIIVMDEDATWNVQRFSKDHTIELEYERFTSFFGDESLHEIPEPTQGEGTFEDVYHQIEQGVANLIQKIKHTPHE